jgi:hypothetical protein
MRHVLICGRRWKDQVLISAEHVQHVGNFRILFPLPFSTNESSFFFIPAAIHAQHTDSLANRISSGSVSIENGR